MAKNNTLILLAIIVYVVNACSSLFVGALDFHCGPKMINEPNNSKFATQQCMIYQNSLAKRWDTNQRKGRLKRSWEIDEWQGHTIE